MIEFDKVAEAMEAMLDDLPETLSLDDLKHHPGLRRIILAADSLSNMVDRRALEWAKSQ